MGDGQVKKFAIIINGDQEAHHIANVEQAANYFEKEGYDDVKIASPKSPQGKIIDSYQASSKQIDKLIQGIQSDDDDLITVYITGDGNQTKKQESCAVMQDQSCLSYRELKEKLKSLDYGKRIVITDASYGGNSIHLFSDPKTIFYSLGKPGEATKCQDVMPYFFSSKIPDKDKNGIVDIGEQIDYAENTGHYYEGSLFFNPGPLMSLAGKEVGPTFEPDLKTVHNKTDLRKLIKENLSDGRLALVMFSQDYCGWCKHYEPILRDLAKRDGGNFLVIKAEGINSQESWSSFGISGGVPRFRFIDQNFVTYPLDHGDDKIPIKLVNAPNDTYAFASRFENLPRRLSQLLDKVKKQESTPEELMQTLLSFYDKFKLYNPPPPKKKSESELASKIRKIHELVESFVQEILKVIEDPKGDPSIRGNIMEALVRSFIEEPWIQAMVDTSLFRMVAQRFLAIATNNNYPKSFRDKAKNLIIVAKRIKKFNHPKPNTQQTGFPEGFMHEISHSTQKSWVLLALIRAKRNWEGGITSLSSSEQTQYAHALLNIYHTYQKQGRFSNFDPDNLESRENAILASLILQELSSLNFDPTEPSILPIIDQIWRDTNLSKDEKIQWMLSLLNQQVSNNRKGTQSFSVRTLMARVLKPIKDPQDSESRQQALKTVQSMPTDLQFAFHREISSALKTLISEHLDWKKDEVSGEVYLERYWVEKGVDQKIKINPQKYYEKEWRLANEILSSFTKEKFSFPLEEWSV